MESSLYFYIKSGNKFIFKKNNLKEFFGNSSFSVTIGNFDGVHLGHQNLLKRLNEVAEKNKTFKAAITFEPHPSDFFKLEKNFFRIFNLRQKVHYLFKNGIDLILIYKFNKIISEYSSLKFLEEITSTLPIKYLVAGDNFNFGKNKIGGINELRKYENYFKYKLICQNILQKNGYLFGSSAIRDKLRNNDFIGVRDILGRNYSIISKVVRGSGLGRKIGFPTANLAVKNFILNGVFGGIVTNIGEWPIYCLINSGVRPSREYFNKVLKNEGKRKTVEIFLITEDINLYNKELCVEFLFKIRDEKIFFSADLLKRQIKKDIEFLNKMINIS